MMAARKGRIKTQEHQTAQVRSLIVGKAEECSKLEQFERKNRNQVDARMPSHTMARGSRIGAED